MPKIIIPRRGMEFLSRQPEWSTEVFNRGTARANVPNSSLYSVVVAAYVESGRSDGSVQVDLDDEQTEILYGLADAWLTEAEDGTNAYERRSARAFERRLRNYRPKGEHR